MKSVYIAVLLAVYSMVAADPIEQQFSACAACHGQSAQGNDVLGAPALAGQSAVYLTRQLNNFANGIRGDHKDDQFGAQMLASITAIDESDFSDLARYASAFATSTTTVADGDLQKGQKLYQSYCGSCHGSAAQGNDILNAPRLTGLSALYLQRQYSNFLNKVRGVKAEDRYGRQMAIMATAMKQDQQIKDVIAYITKLNKQ